MLLLLLLSLLLLLLLLLLLSLSLLLLLLLLLLLFQPVIRDAHDALKHLQALPHMDAVCRQTRYFRIVPNKIGVAE
jgi:hypothetical protein